MASATRPNPPHLHPRLFRRPARASSRPPTGALLVAAALALLGLAAASVAFVGVAGAAFAAYRAVTRDLPSVEEIAQREVFKSVRILDRNGELLAELSSPKEHEGRRTIVRLSELPQHLIDATIATEDADFYQNPGIDVRGIARAALLYVQHGRVVGGGSTITQQLIKNTLLDEEERTDLSLARKVREAVLAFRLAQRYSKNQILELYLNEIYYGRLAYGIEAAAQTYFGKSARELTLAESALLAGLPQLPAAYDPFKNPEAARARQAQVLDLMVRHGHITPAQADAAKLERLRYAGGAGVGSSRAVGPAVRRAPHFVQYVQDLLWERYGPDLFRLGLTVTTTLDGRLQALAEAAVQTHARELADLNARNAALVALDPRSGAILAMVGSPNFDDAENAGQVNAALALRQPGSAIKPIVYLAAFQKGFGPGTVVLDEPIRLSPGRGQPAWTPQNVDNRFRGPVTLRRALGASLNVPAVKVLQFAGLPATIELARQLGLESLKDPAVYGLSFALGGGEVRLLELTSAYGVLANGGVRQRPTPFLKIEDAEGRVLFAPSPGGERVADPRHVWLVTDILSDNQARAETFGLNSPLRLDRPAAAKTGSTDDYRDSWTLGYTPDLVAGVWVGNADGTPTKRVLGSSGAGKIWHTFMTSALAGRPVLAFEQPEGLVRATICATTGFLATADCRTTVSDWFLAGQLPRPETAALRRYAIDTASGKLATAFCPLDTIVFKAFPRTTSGDGEAPPTEYCDIHRTPVRQPWEIPPTPTATPAPAPSPTPLAGPAARPTAAPPAPAAVQVAITSPAPGERVSGAVRIVGSAALPGFQSYRLEWGAGPAPTAWQPVGAARAEQVVNGLLGTWDTATVRNGSYTLRLTVTDRAGGTQQARVTVTVAN